MGLTISHLFTPTAFKYPPITVAGQIAVNGSTTAPSIEITDKITGSSPTWISDTEPTRFKYGYVGATWYNPGEGSFKVKYGPNDGEWWFNGSFLFGATTNKSTSFGRWGLVDNESPITYGPEKFTGLSPGNPPEYRAIGGVCSNVRINTQGLPERASIDAQDCVHIDSDQDGSDSSSNSGTVSIGRNSFGFALNLSKAVGVGWLALDLATRYNTNISDVPVVAVGGQAARDLRGGQYWSAVFVGSDCGTRLKSPDDEKSDVCLVNAGNFVNQDDNWALRNLVMFGTRAGVSTPTISRGIRGDILAIGDGGQVKEDKVLSIGGNNIHNQNGKQSTSIIAAPDSTPAANYCTTLGSGSAVAISQTGAVELSPGGNNGTYLRIGDLGDFRFKDNKPGNPGQILVSGGPNNGPQWKTAVNIIEFRSDDGKTIRVTNGLITSIS
jgi:hypothetical protein